MFATTTDLQPLAQALDRRRRQLLPGVSRAGHCLHSRRETPGVPGAEAENA